MILTVEKERGGYSLVAKGGKRVAVGIAAKETADNLAAGFKLITEGGTVTVCLPGEVHSVDIKGTFK